MSISRRQFLAGLGATLATGVAVEQLNAAGNTDRKVVDVSALWNKKEAGWSANDLQDEKLLMKSYFPTLIQNEKERLYFYRDCRNKVTVGYGTNVQDNSAALTGVSVFEDGRKLSDTEKQTFVKGMMGKTKSELRQYTVSRADATMMALKDMHNRISCLRDLLRDDKTRKTIFFDLPVCMQALCLDVMYNRGIAGFAREYKKFQAAIKRRDFPTAVKESKIYVNAAKRVVNTYRERRKQRFLRILNIVRENKEKPMLSIKKQLSQDYTQNVPILVRLLNGTEDMSSEWVLAKGEMEHIRLQKERMQGVAATKAKANAMRALSQKRGM